MKSINEVFDHVYYINLDRRADRNEQMISELSKNNIAAERVSAVDGSQLVYEASKIIQFNGSTLKPGNLALMKTNKIIFEDAKSKGYESILILEDDALFIDNFTDYFEVMYNQVPSDWQMLYLGGNQVTFPDLINDNIGKCKMTYTTHAVAFKKEIYDIVLNEINKLNNPIDVMYAGLYEWSRPGSIKAYTFLPSIVLQRGSFSDIENKYVDYVAGGHIK